jgi:hypothetical protein
VLFITQQHCGSGASRGSRAGHFTAARADRGQIVVDLPRRRTVATTELPAFVNLTREVRRHLNSASTIE